MCGRYKLSNASLNRLLDEFAAEMPHIIDYGPRYNIAPTTNVLAVRQPEQGAKRELVELRWGLIPVWAKDAKIDIDLDRSSLGVNHNTIVYDPMVLSTVRQKLRQKVKP